MTHLEVESLRELIEQGRKRGTMGVFQKVFLLIMGGVPPPIKADPESTKQKEASRPRACGLTDFRVVVRFK
jgi:hypothetical protein